MLDHSIYSIAGKRWEMGDGRLTLYVGLYQRHSSEELSFTVYLYIQSLPLLQISMINVL